MRLKIIRVTVVVLFVIIALDLFYVQIIQGGYFYNLSVNNRIRVVPVAAPRGRILDRNGVALVDNRLSFDVSVVPQDIKDSGELFDFLSNTLKVEKKKLLQLFFQKKITPFAPVVIAEDVDKAAAMVLEENRYRFPGVYIEESFRRWYPFGPAGAHVLGYVGKIDRAKIAKLEGYGYSPESMVGYSGVEEY
jgi:penicillin-binding protein 2